MNAEKPDEPMDPTMGGFLVDCDAGKITQNYWDSITSKTAVPTNKPAVTATVPSPGKVNPRKGSGSGEGDSQGEKRFSDTEEQEQKTSTPVARQPKQMGKGTFSFDPTRR